MHFSPNRGLLGRGIRSPHLLEFPLKAPWAVVLHSDGISSRGLEIGMSLSAEKRAQQILATAARITDDATVVVIESRDPVAPDATTL